MNMYFLIGCVVGGLFATIFVSILSRKDLEVILELQKTIEQKNKIIKDYKLYATI